MDSTYTYNVEYQGLSAKATISEGTQGEIWVADQEGWSPFVVRAQLLQTTTTQVEGGPSGLRPCTSKRTSPISFVRHRD